MLPVLGSNQNWTISNRPNGGLKIKDQKSGNAVLDDDGGAVPAAPRLLVEEGAAPSSGRRGGASVTPCSRQLPDLALVTHGAAADMRADARGCSTPFR